MKLLFVVTGIGLGHTIREKTIIDEILKKNPETTIHVAGYGLSLDYFKSLYPTTKIFGHKFSGDSFKPNAARVFMSNLLYPIKYLIDTARLILLIKRFNPDKIIVDTQPVGVFAARLMKKKSVCIYNFDVDRVKEKLEEASSRFFVNLVKKMYNRAGKVIIPVLTQQKSIRKNIHYIDPVVRASPDLLQSKDVLMKKLKLKKEPILVAIGGSNFGIKLLDLINEIAERFDEQFIIFNGSYKKKNITSYKFKSNFLEYLKVSKAVITTAGHNTLSEILVFKKPALVFPIANYLEQKQNAGMVKDANLCLVSNFVEDPERLELLIKKLLNDKSRLIGNIEKLELKASGASEAAKIILS